MFGTPRLTTYPVIMAGLFPGVCESSLKGDVMLGGFLIVEFLMF